MEADDDARTTARVRRWSVSGVGLLLVAVSAGSALTDAGAARPDVLRLAATGAGLLVVGYGAWLARRVDHPTEAGRVAVWVGGIAVAFALVEAGQVALWRNAGAADVTLVASSLTVGAVAGVVVGHHDYRRRVEAAAAKRARTALEAARDGVAILRDDGTYESVNPSFARIRGYESPDALVGRQFRESFTDAEAAFIESTVRPALDEHGQWEGELTAERRDGTAYVQATTIARLDGDGSVVVARDVTQRREQERRLQTVVANAPVAIFEYDAEGVVEFVEGTLAEDLGLAGNALVDQDVRDVFPDDTSISATVERALDGEHVEATVELAGRHLQTWADPVVEDGDVVRVVGTAVDVTDRVEYEESLATLHDATRQMMSAESEERICEVAVETARSTLDLPLTGVWLVDETGDHLEPAVATPEKRRAFTTLPTYDASYGEYWRAFESGDTTVVDSPEPSTGEAETERPIRSEVVAPLGGYGVLKAGIDSDDGFDEGDVSLLRLLAANTATALERAEREATLELRTDQMEFFNSILRHDVLNGMTVIRARGEVLAEDLDGTHGQYAETIVSWCDDVTDVVSRVRRVIQALTSETEPELEATDLDGCLREEVERVADTYPAVTFETDIDDHLVVRADELLSEVLGNLVTNAVEHNDHEGLVVRVTATERGADVVVRVADNGRGVPDEVKDAIFRRGESGHAKATGSGFGLFFVDAMVDAYGGEVWVEDNDVGGATFVVELSRAAVRNRYPDSGDGQN